MSKNLFDTLNSMIDNTPHSNSGRQNVTGIIYGDSGGGKTVLAMTLAHRILKINGGEILFFDAVNAWRSLKNHPDLLHDYSRIPYAGKSQLETFVKAIEQGDERFTKYSVLILDEMSSMTDKDLDTVLAARSKLDPSKDPDVATQPDMGASTERMRRVTSDLLKLDISVIFVSHQRNDEDKSVGFKTTRPRFMPKFSGTIREGLDFVVHMSASQKARDGALDYVRFVQAHPTTSVVAKTRVGGLKLKNSPDEFVEGVGKWLELGKTVDAVELPMVNDSISVDNMSEDITDFGGIEV